MKSYIAHYKNKYGPEAQVSADDRAIRVYVGGALKVALDKNGAGQWQDVSEELGADDCHCLSPIPVEARAWKLDVDGKLKKHEQHAERIAWQKEAIAKYGKVYGQKEFEAVKSKEAKAAE